MCACRGCYLLFTSRRRGRRSLPGGARPLPRVPRPPAVARAVGRAADPGERRVLLRQLDARPGRRVLSRARPARPSRCCRSTPGTSSSPRTPTRRRSSPTSRRSSCAPTARRGRSGVLPRADRRLLRARRPPAHAVARLRRRPRGARRARRLLRRRAGEGAMTDLALRGARRARRSRTPRCRRSCSGCASPRRRGAPVHALALRCQIRIEPQRRRYDARRGGAARRAVRRATAVGRLAAPVPLDPRRHDGHRVHRRRPRSTSRSTCTYDFEVAATKYLHALDDGEIPLVLLFSGTVFTAGDAGLRGRAGGVARGGVVPAPGRGLARR